MPINIPIAPANHGLDNPFTLVSPSPAETFHISIWRASDNMLDVVVVSVFEFPEDISGEVILDLTVTSDGLAGTSFGILVPIMTPTVSDENTSVLFDLANEVNSLHAI